MIKSMFKKAAGKNSPANLPTSLPYQQLLDSFNEGIRSVTDYLVVAEQEETKRTEILASRDIALESIRSQRDTITKLMCYMFEERAQVIQKQFDVLDFALETGNVAMADAAMKSMVNVIQSSPFKTIQEMQQAMGSKDFIVRLE